MPFNVADVTPLIRDEYVDDPVRRLHNYLLKKRDQGAHLVGLYCGYAPVELIRAMNAAPISLCSSSQKTIPAAEAVLPPTSAP